MKIKDIVTESQLVESMPRKLYASEIRKYFSGDDYSKLSSLLKSGGSNNPVKVQSDDGKFYTAIYDCGRTGDGYGMDSCIKLKSAKGLSESQINELDNGPNGTYNDNIKYSVGRSTQTNFSKTSGQKAALPARKEPAPKAPKVRAERPVREPKPKAEPKPRIARFSSSEPKNELEQYAKDSMYAVWQMIGGDVPDLQDPYEIAEMCTDANRLQLMLDLSPEEESWILGLGQKTLARLASNFGY